MERYSVIHAELTLYIINMSDTGGSLLEKANLRGTALDAK